MIKKTNDVSLKDALSMMIQQKRWKTKLDRVKVADVWRNVVGETINNYTKHVTLRNKTLVVLIESAPLKQELSYGKDKLIKLMNEAIGEDLIEDVILH